jgi:uncharacterized phage protein gp47/JayE
MGILNEKGYDSSSYATKRENFVTVFKTAFGNTIRTEEESAQGQIIDYTVAEIDNEDKIGLSFFNQLNYRNAQGVLLSAIAVTKGQPRKNGTQAVITCNFTSSSTTYTITAGSQFRDTSTNFIFENTSPINISNLSQSAQLVAKNNGATRLIPTNTLEAQGYYPNLTNIAITSIQDGTDDETDNQLIARLDNATSETGINDVDAIFDRLINLPNVTRAVVLENDTDATVDGRPPHSIEVIVLGGLDDDIAKVIFNTKASGTPTAGDIEVVVFDIQQFPRIIRFRRPTLVPMYARIRITARQGRPITANTVDLRQKTLEYINNLRIGFDVSRTPIFGIWGDGDFDIVQISLSTDGTVFVDTNIDIATRDFAFVDDLNQIILENV